MQYKYGLIGKSLGHSFSKKYFEHKFKKDGLTNYQYDNYEFEKRSEIISFLNSTHCLGLNVTLPYKETILDIITELDRHAKAIGAVNTLKRYPDGTFKGFNTDTIGFRESLSKKPDPSQKALILGSGGASKAIMYCLNQMGIETITVSRKPKSINQVDYEALKKLELDSFELIVNCTPIGTSPDIDKHPVFPFEKLNEKHQVYDLIYNPSRTLFLEKARMQGASIQNGEAMLRLQAEASWKIWHDSTI